MKINFNDVLKAAMPDSIEIELDGKEYRLKELAVLDVAGYEALREPLGGESEEAHAGRILGFLRDWFDGEAPPFLAGAFPTEPRERRRRMVRVTALAGTIAQVVVELGALPNVMARSQEATRAQISRASTTGSDS